MAAPLTPADVKSREFSFSRKGYDPIDVDEFVDEVCETLALYKAREEAFQTDHAQDQAAIQALRMENERLVSDVSRVMEEAERVNAEVARANAEAAHLNAQVARAGEENSQLRAELSRLSHGAAEPREDSSGAALELLRSAQETASKTIGVALAQAERISQDSEAEMERAKAKVMDLRRVEDDFRSQLIDLIDRIRLEAETGVIGAGSVVALESGPAADVATTDVATTDVTSTMEASTTDVTSTMEASTMDVSTMDASTMDASTMDVTGRNDRFAASDMEELPPAHHLPAPPDVIDVPGMGDEGSGHAGDHLAEGSGNADQGSDYLPVVENLPSRENPATDEVTGEAAESHDDSIERPHSMDALPGTDSEASHARDTVQPATRHAAPAPWDDPQPVQAAEDAFIWEPSVDPEPVPAATSPAKARASATRKRVEAQEWPGLIDYAAEAPIPMDRQDQAR